MESLWVMGDGLRLHASRWEPPVPHAGTQVLALHGFTGDSQDFSLLAERSLNRFRWNALDLPGHGLSDAPTHPAPYTAARCVRHLQRAERELGLHDYILLGYSMGARLALTYALEHPENLSALILVGGTAGIVDEREQRERRIQDERIASHLLQTDMQTFIDAWNTQSLIASQRNISPPVYAAMLERRYRNRPAGLANSLRAFGTGTMPPLWNKLPTLEVPVLLVSGAQDIKFSVLAREMEFRLPFVTRTQIFGAGHCAHLEQPDRFIRLLEDYAHHEIAA